MWGAWARHLINIANAIQIIVVLAVITLGSGQAISQISQGPSGTGGLCFIVCLLIFMLAGWVTGQIRTLQKISWMANFCVWINVLVIFIM